MIKDSGITNIDICLSIYDSNQLKKLKEIAASGDEFKDLSELLEVKPIKQDKLEETGLPSTRDEQIREFINFVQGSEAGDLSKIKATAKESKIEKEDLVAYIRKLDPKKQETLIKNIFKPDTALHAYFSIQRGLLGTAEHRGTFKQLAEIIDPSLKKLNYFSRTTDKYRNAVHNIKEHMVVDPAPLAEVPPEPPQKGGHS